MTDRPGNDGAAHGANSEASRSFLQDVMDHTQQTWSHVGQGNASAGEYIEAVAEVAAVAVLAKFAASRFLGKGGAVATKSLLVERGLQTEILKTAPVVLRQGAQKSVVCAGGLLESGAPLTAAARAEGLHPAITALRSGSETLHPAITGLRSEALHPAITALRPGSEALHPAVMGLRSGGETLHPAIMALRPGTERAAVATSALVESSVPLNVVTRGEAALKLGNAAFHPEVCGGVSIEETSRRIAQIQLGAEQRLTAQLVESGIPITAETREAVKNMTTMRPGARAEALRRILESK